MGGSLEQGEPVHRGWERVGRSSTGSNQVTGQAAHSPYTYSHPRHLPASTRFHRHFHRPAHPPNHQPRPTSHTSTHHSVWPPRVQQATCLERVFLAPNSQSCQLLRLKLIGR